VRAITDEAYVQEVLRVLNAFLFFNPNRGDLEADRILSVIEEDYHEQGIAPRNAGVQIGAAVLIGQIAQMNPDDRVALTKELRELSDQQREQFREMALGQQKGGEWKFPPGITMATIMIATAMAFARDALERGEIGPVTFEAVETGIFGALNGDTPNRG
jgi:hypothetical protein